jgi:sporulation protein YlmC with PRC-barrel domain
MATPKEVIRETVRTAFKPIVAARRSTVSAESRRRSKRGENEAVFFPPRDFYVLGLGRRAMPEILAENLSGKAVMGADGAELGMLYNITMDTGTGRLRNLVVEPSAAAEREADFESDGDDHVLVPIDRVQAVKDHIIIRRE